MSRGRYARVQQDDLDDDEDLSLILGQPLSSNYVRLSDLDPEGHPRVPNQAKTRAFRRTPRALLYSFLTFVGLLVVVTTGAHLFGRRIGHYVPNRPLSNGTHMFNATTLVISLDGFHPQYISKERTPNLDKMARNECVVPYMIPSFPSQTFPNHWTLVTGLYPANHGIVGNTFLDPKLGEFVNTDPSKSRNPGFWGGEPAWITARNQSRRVGVHMWPGSEVDWASGKPDYVTKFNRSEPLTTKAKSIIDWFDEKGGPPELMLAYVPQVDVAGHTYGIAGDEVTKAINEVDQFIGSLQKALQVRNLTHIVNFVVVSDHGMAPTSDERIFILDDHINMNNVTSKQGWPLAGLRFTDSEAEEMALKSLRASNHEGVDIFAAENLPKRWHFGPKGFKYSYRLSSLYVVPKVGWSIVTQQEWDDMNHHYDLKGVHGYDNAETTMRALFVAQGPAFPPGRYEPFMNIDFYSGICQSIGVRPSENDGSFRLIRKEKPMDLPYPELPFGTDFISDSSIAEIFQKP